MSDKDDPRFDVAILVVFIGVVPAIFLVQLPGLPSLVRAFGVLLGTIAVVIIIGLAVMIGLGGRAARDKRRRRGGAHRE